MRRVALLALLAACGRTPEAAPSSLAGVPAPIVLVVIDTLRADHTSLHGGARDTTPFLRELSEHAIVFERAYSTASWTRPSMASVFTSRLPESHGCEGRQGRLSPTLVTLPEVLRDRGWDTRAVVSNGNLDAVWGFDQGWASYHCVRGLPLQPCANAAFLEPIVGKTIAALSAPPFLLYLHYVDPHDPYDVHPDHSWDPDYAGSFDGSEDSIEPFRQRAPSPANRQRVLDLYDGEISFVDASLHRALGPLASTGLLDAAWLVITSDHGEGLWDHEELGHCGEVFQGQIHVPLLVRPPGGLSGPRRVREVFSLLDLAPTLLELVGAPVPESFEGRSWAPFVLGRGSAPERPVFVDEQVDDTNRAAVVDGRRKLIADARSGSLLFYDLVTNPTERADLANDLATDPVPAGLQLRDLLERALLAARARRPSDNRVPPDAVPADVTAQLRALGYLGGR